MRLGTQIQRRIWHRVPLTRLLEACRVETSRNGSCPLNFLTSVWLLIWTPWFGLGLITAMQKDEISKCLFRSNWPFFRWNSGDFMTAGPIQLLNLPLFVVSALPNTTIFSCLVLWQPWPTLGPLLLLIRHSGITSLLLFFRLFYLLPFPRLFLVLSLTFFLELKSTESASVWFTLWEVLYNHVIWD